MLKHYFSGAPGGVYGQLLELFNETTWQTELGQLLDLTSQPPPAVGAVDLDRFTLERYRSIVRYKTAYYSFVLPVACGFILAGGRYAAKATLDASESILLLMGEYFQVRFAGCLVRSCVGVLVGEWVGPVGLTPIVDGLTRCLCAHATSTCPTHPLWQVQDDVLDAFAPPEVLGKVGTDIQVRPRVVRSTSLRASSGGPRIWYRH